MTRGQEGPVVCTRYAVPRRAPLHRARRVRDTAAMRAPVLTPASVAAAAPPAAPAPHRPTPTGRPSWYGTAMAREERSWLSATGDVELFAGNTFATGFSRLSDAEQHARAASDGARGAVLVMEVRDPKDHRATYWLARSYNAESQAGTGLVVGQTHLDTAPAHCTQWHPEVRALIDGNVRVSATPSE